MTRDEEREYGDYVAARTDALRRFAYLLSGDWHRAEDVVQTALTRLYVAWRRVRRRDEMDAYVRRIVVRALIDERRRAWFRRERSSAALPELVVADHAPGTADRLAVLAALSQVPPRQRAALVLRFWEDLPVEQVAELLRCAPGTVKSQTARGLQTLRGLLEPSGSRQVGGSS